VTSTLTALGTVSIMKKKEDGGAGEEGPFTRRGEQAWGGPDVLRHGFVYNF